jgi:hypothetical protein
LPQRDQLQINSPQYSPFSDFARNVSSHTLTTSKSQSPTTEIPDPPKTSAITNKLLRTPPRIVEFETHDFGTIWGFRVPHNPSLNIQTQVTEKENYRKVWFIYSIYAVFFLIHSFQVHFIKGIWLRYYQGFFGLLTV